MDIDISQPARNMGIRVRTGTLEGIRVRDSQEVVLTVLMQEVKEGLRAKYPEDVKILRDVGVRAFRDLYWRIGIDPTKTRPASEALVRRILKKEIPSINTLVDAGNLASASTGIPIGLYDMDRLKGDPRIVIAQGGEEFHPIGGQPISLDPGTPVLVDDAGVVHLYPYRDCMRTRITNDTQRALVVACGAKGIGDRYLEEAILAVRKYFRDLSGG